MSSLRMKKCSRSLHLTIGENDRVYAPRDTRKRSIAAERLLRCRPTFSKSLMVSVAVSKLGCSPVFFVELGIKVDGRYYWDVLLKQHMLPVMRRIAGDTYCTCSSRIAPQLTALATLSSYCSRRRQSSFHPTCGRQTAKTWTRSTTVYGVSCGNEFTRLQCVTQLTSSGASLRLGRAFRRQSSTKQLPSGGYDYEPVSKQRDVTSNTRWCCNQPALFRATKR